MKNLLHIFTSLKFPSCFMMYFCFRQRKFKCRNFKRENSHTCCSKVQRQKTPQEAHSLFVWDEKCCKETFELVET